MDLNNREIASLVWLGVLAMYAGRRQGVRDASRAVLRAFWHPKVAGLVALYALYLAGVLLVASHLGLWQTTQTKDTLLWLAVPGVTLLFNALNWAEKPGFFRRALLATVRGTAFVEFYINITPLPLFGELVLLPVIALLTVASTVAARNPEQASVKAVSDALLALMGIGLLLYTSIEVWQRWDTLDREHLLRTFVLPLWLTAASVPFLYVWGLYATYEVALIRVLLRVSDPWVRWRARVALVRVLGLRGDLVSRFVAPWSFKLAEAKSLAEALAIVRAYRRGVERPSPPRAFSRVILVLALVTVTAFAGVLLLELPFAAPTVLVASLVAVAALWLLGLASAVAERRPAAVLLALVSLVLIYAVLYRSLGQLDPSAIHTAAGPITSAQAVYFSFLVGSTLGFGDIVPTSDAARGLVVLELVTVLSLAIAAGATAWKGRTIHKEFPGGGNGDDAESPDAT